MVHYESHNAGNTVFGRIGNDGKAADHLTIDDIIICASDSMHHLCLKDPVIIAMIRNGLVFGFAHSVFPGRSLFDMVTTTAYIKKNVPALSLAGTKKWLPRKVLVHFAIVHLSLPPRTIVDTFSRLADWREVKIHIKGDTFV